MATNDSDDTLRRIDLAHLGEIRSATNEKVLAELVDVFVASMGEQVEALTLAVDATNNESALRMCHSMKGSAGAVGAQTLTECCRKLETELQDSAGVDRVPALMIALNDEYQASAAALRAYIADRT